VSEKGLNYRDVQYKFVVKFANDIPEGGNILLTFS